MARRHGRRMAMAAAGLATAATPLLFGQEVAGAAVTAADDSVSLTFVTNNTGQTVTCTASLDARHDTDNSSQPELTWATGLEGVPACFESFSSFVTATYKDSEGVTRTVTGSAFKTTSGSATGAYTATSVRADITFFNCDFSRSAACDVTLIASPK